MISHEVYHCYQIYCINNREKMLKYEADDTIRLWENNYYHYMSDSSAEDYDLQDLELYAIIFSAVISVHIYNEMLERVPYLIEKDEFCKYVLEDLLYMYPKEKVLNCINKYNVDIELFIKLDEVFRNFLEGNLDL